MDSSGFSTGFRSRTTEAVAAILKVTGDWQKFKVSLVPKAHCSG